MKQKFFNASVVLAILILSFGFSNLSTAQTSESTNTATGTVKNSADAMYMQTPDANTGVYKTENGTAEVDANGTVTLTTTNANGDQVGTKISKPTGNLTVEFGSDLETFTTNYIQWLKANPEFQNYVSAYELEMIQAGNYEGLYRHANNVAQKQLQNQ